MAACRGGIATVGRARAIQLSDGRFSDIVMPTERRRHVRRAVLRLTGTPPRTFEAFAAEAWL